MDTNLVIIGGGITGLSAAWEAQKNLKPGQITLLESSSRWGGKIITGQIQLGNARFIVDGGPESFITRKPDVWELANELGILDEVIDPGSETRHIYVLDGGRPAAVPLTPRLFITSRLLSARAKFRLLAEPFIPPRKDPGDESLADFANRRLGMEAQEKMLGPILAGIYNTDPARQSVLATSPIMREMEAEAGSLVLAAVQRMFRKTTNANGMPKPPRFIAFKHGAQTLVDALVNNLRATLRLKAPVRKISKIPSGYTIHLQNGSQIKASHVLITTPANVATNLLSGEFEPVAAKLSAIRHTNIGTISLVYKKQDIPENPHIHGLMIPRREKRAIDAVTFTSLKMPERGAEGYVLLRVFLGGARPEMVTSDKTTLLKEVRRELTNLLGITAEPLAELDYRWADSFPQADVGHLDRVAEVESLLPPGLALTGSSYRGIGVPDCIRQGRETIKTLLSNS